MNIEEYNLDSLRRIVRDLQKENKMLKSQLINAGIPFNNKDVFVEKITENVEYDEDQGSRIQERYITDEMIKWYFSMFWGREDVYAERSKNGNYYPQCDNRWSRDLCPKQRNEKIDCNECENTRWKNLTVETVRQHLLGYRQNYSGYREPYDYALGIYPLFPDGTCRFIVFDFDNHEKGSEQEDFANKNDEWHDEVNALRIICEKNGICPLVERSRSGKGAHVWIFFKKRIPASLARNFGFLLLDKGASSINLKSFHYYDRMYPCQEYSKSLGNLIALPLQKYPIRQGNTAFVDENWNAYPDQWDMLLNKTPKYSQEDINNYIVKWRAELSESNGMINVMLSRERPKPWRRNDNFTCSDVVGKLHMVLADGVYIDTLNLMPRLQNQIRSMAAFDNPIFYKNRRLGFSNYYNFSAIYMGIDKDGFICVPRGLKEKIMFECNKAGISYDIEDMRGKGRPIRVNFNGELKKQQKVAVKNLLTYDDGILSAATAFGKTVVCSYLIASRKVSTLIIVNNKELLNQWLEELNKFLTVDEEMPEYKTPKGKIKKRDSVFGVLNGSKNTLSGIIDVAMIQSLSGKEEIDDIVETYGMVIMDECHHGASEQAVSVLKKINSRYLYGVSATPKRTDDLEKIVYMLIGPIRHLYTAKERAAEQGIGHYVYPRYTRIIDISGQKKNIAEAYSMIGSNTVRNEMIIEDVKKCVAQNRTPIILTRQREQAKFLYDNLKYAANHVYLLYGDNTDRKNQQAVSDMRSVPQDETVIMIATGQKAGEGFNYPRLDTLMLSAPVSSPQLLEQYVGRLNRDYEGKQDVIVYDYVDAHLGVFKNMFNNRLRTYKKLGYVVITDIAPNRQNANAIYDAGNYADIFEQDIIEAEKSIIIASPKLQGDKIKRLIYVTKARQEAGVKVTVMTLNPDCITMGSSDYHMHLIKELNDAGIEVITREEENEHFAVMDDELVWHGGMNLLGKEDVWDNLIRVKNKDIAAELLEKEFSNK